MAASNSKTSKSGSARSPRPREPKNTLSQLFFGPDEERKVRGKVAETIFLPCFLSFLGKTSVMVMLESIISLYTYSFFFFVSYETAFYQDHSPWMQSVFHAGSAIYILDLLLRLGVELWRFQQSRKLDCIFFIVPFSFRMYLFEIIVLFPYHLFHGVIFMDSVKGVVYYPLFYVPRCLLAVRIFIFIDALQNRLFSPFWAFMIRFYIVYFAFIHLVACFLSLDTGLTYMDHMLSRKQDHTHGFADTWLGHSQERRQDVGITFFDNYMHCLLYSVISLFTVGFFHPHAFTEFDMVVAAVIMLVGSIGFAGFFGSKLTSFLLELDGARFDFFHRVEIIGENLKEMGATSIFSDKVMDYYRFLWNLREGVFEEPQILSLVPPVVSRDIPYDICTEMFAKSILFRGMDESFLRAVSKRAEVVLVGADVIVCHQGKPAMTMHYIIQGECMVKCKHNSNITAAILRAGCIFGEMSFLLSMANTVNVETKTACQLLRVRKDALMDLFNDHIPTLSLVRERFEESIEDLKFYYTMTGEHPVTFTYFNQAPDTWDETPFADHPTILRWSHGLNTIVQAEDIIDDTESTVIVDMPCPDPAIETKNSLVAYTSCVIPPTLGMTPNSVHRWHIFVAVFGTYYCFTSTYSIAFGLTNELAYYWSHTHYFIEIAYTIIALIDVFVEILTACPASGIYHKFWDGIRIKSRQVFFYCDIIAVIPVMLVFYTTGDSSVDASSYVFELHMYGGLIALKCCKMIHKVVRYLKYLAIYNPNKIFWLRLLEVLFVFLNFNHFLACILFVTACPPKPWKENGNVYRCHKSSWISSKLMEEFSMHVHQDPDSPYQALKLSNRIPYIVSLYFAAATTTSAGFGDFQPRGTQEIIIVALVLLVSFNITGYYTAGLTSALACVTRPTVFFQQKLVSIRQFLETNGLSNKLQDRIVEHYLLQQQYNRGVILPPGVQSFMYDAPPYLEDDALYSAFSTMLEGIPIFSNVSQRVIIKMAKSLIRTVLPPNIYFLRRGEVLVEDTPEVKQIFVASCHFGIRDLLYGEPCHNNIQTLSHCVIYSIDLDGYHLALGWDDVLEQHVDKMKHEKEDNILKVNSAYRTIAHKIKIVNERRPKGIPSWIKFPSPDHPMDTKEDERDFAKPYQGRLGRVWKCLLMMRTVHPAGTFALFWSLLMGVVAVFLALFQTTQLYLYYHHTSMNIVILIMRVLIFADMYIRMHWAYYTEANHLVCHPMLTASRYIFGGGLAYGFILELFPYYLVFVCLGAVDFNLNFTGEGLVWLAKLNFLVALVRLHRFPIIVSFAHRIFRWRAIVLMMLYMVMTLLVAAGVGIFALNMACPWDGSPWKDGYDDSYPACLKNTWISIKIDTEDVGEIGFWKRWVLALYYVCQMIFVLGYGDMVSTNQEEMMLTIFLVIFGYIATQVVISDITAASVDNDIIRANFAEQMRTLVGIMLQENVHRKLIGNVKDHMEHTWMLSKGLQPQVLLRDLHPALQADLFKEYIGDAVSRVPLLSGVSDNILRTVYTYMRKYYFRRGERIMRRGNLEFEMYIIVDGDVWIADKNLEYKCMLGPGECMGETQMIYGLQRRYTAVAGNSVELFSLSSTAFSEILVRYPGLLEDLKKNLNHERNDLFERKIAVNDEAVRILDEKKREAVALRYLEYSAQIREIVYVREVPGFGEDEEDTTVVAELINPLKSFVHRNICSHGAQNANLPYLYFASPDDREEDFAFLLHPNCGFRRHFQVLVKLSCFLSAVLSMYQVFFGTEELDFQYHSPVIITTLVCEVVYIVHMVFEFITPFPTVHGMYCKTFRNIALRYIIEISRFWLDLLSTFPIQFLPRPVEEFRYLYFLRCLRLVHLYRTIFETRELITTTTFRLNLMISLPSCAIMLHLLTCLFYGVSKCAVPDAAADKILKSTEIPCDTRRWTGMFLFQLTGVRINISPGKHYMWYIRSMYFIVSTVSTTGPGEIVPLTVDEMAIAILAILSGAFVLSIILSLFTSGMMSMFKFHGAYMYQVTLLVKYLSLIGLSNDKIVQLQYWFHLYWQTCRAVPYRVATRFLPLSLQIDVNFALHHITLKKVELFDGLDKRLLRQVAHYLSHTIYMPGMNVMNEGDAGDAMFIVSRGRISGFAQTRHGHARLMRWYNPGSVFGRLPALFYDQTYTKTYRAEVTSEVLVLRQKDIFHLAQNFPALAERLQHYIRQKYSPNVGTNTIFTPTEFSLSQRMFTHKQEGTKTLDRERKHKLREEANQARKQDHHSTGKVISSNQQRMEEMKIEEHMKDLLLAHAALRLNKVNFGKMTDTRGRNIMKRFEQLSSNLRPSKQKKQASVKKKTASKTSSSTSSKQK